VTVGSSAILAGDAGNLEATAADESALLAGERPATEVDERIDRTRCWPMKSASPR
jgi:hypothetical protein